MQNIHTPQSSGSWNGARPAAPRPANESRGEPTRIDRPVEGFYRHRLRSGAVAVGIYIWHGPPTDPHTGEIMDRSWRWQAECNGKPIDFDQVWPACAGDPISEPEYAHLSAVQEWAAKHSPGSPEANPKKRVDWLTAPLTI